MSAKPLSAPEFAEAVITHWPPFRWDEHQELSWTQALVREVGSFDSQVLGNAMAHLVRTRRDTKTPTVAVCIDACATERRYVEAQKAASTLPMHGAAKPKEHQLWEDRGRLADDMVKGPDGKEAARNGWIGTLHAFIVNNGRMPNAAETAACKRQAKEFDQAYDQCVKGGWEQAARLLELGDDMLANRKRLTEMVLRS